MNFLVLTDYQYKDFAEEYLGYSLKGSGRFIKISRTNNEVNLEVKRFSMNRCDYNVFTFFKNKCILSRNYWNNQDLTQNFNEFCERESGYYFN